MRCVMPGNQRKCKGAGGRAKDPPLEPVGIFPSSVCMFLPTGTWAGAPAEARGGMKAQAMAVFLPDELERNCEELRLVPLGFIN